jgi:hypothetical protein
VRVCETGDATLFVNSYAETVEQLAEGRMSAHFFHDFTNARKQTRVVEQRLADNDAVAPEAASITKQPRGVGQRPHWYRSIVRCHSTELVTRNEHSLRAQIRGTKSSGHAGWSTTNNDNIYHLLHAFHDKHND